jgi:hypothetical protein
MPIHPQETPRFDTVEIPPEIARLSNREADRLLVLAEADRRAEIGAYWALCRAEPERAALHAAGAAPIVRDICLLAGCDAMQLPKPSSIGSLFEATARLLAVKAVRNSLLGEYSIPTQAEHVDCFWEDGLVVALKVVGEVPVMVLRYSGPMFNPGAVPEAVLTAGDDWFVVCHREADGNGGEFEFLSAYVIGTMSEDGSWQCAALGLESRGALMRDLPAMEALIEWERLGDDIDGRPMAAFPAANDLLIAQLNVHKAAMREAGRMSAEWRAIVEARTAPLYDRMEQLRRRVQRIEEEIHRLRVAAREVEACALEEETGLARGATVRHKATGEVGVLEMVNFSCQAQFRLRDTAMYVTEDIRRGEWEHLVPPVDGADGVA